MHRISAFLLIGGLVWIGTGSVGAQSPSPVVSDGGYVDVRGEGFAVTFPTDWASEILEGDRRRELSHPDDPEGKYYVPLATASGPGVREVCNVMGLTGLEEVAGWTSVHEAVDVFFGAMQGSGRWAETERDVIDLPMGTVERMLGHEIIEDWHYAGYVMSDHGVWLSFECYADEPPEDRWVAIAATFELLPQEDLAASP